MQGVTDVMSGSRPARRVQIRSAYGGFGRSQRGPSETAHRQDLSWRCAVKRRSPRSPDRDSEQTPPIQVLLYCGWENALLTVQRKKMAGVSRRPPPSYVK